jgi:hypothetical protein
MSSENDAITSPTLLGRLRQSPDDARAWEEFARRYGSMMLPWRCL